MEGKYSATELYPLASACWFMEVWGYEYGALQESSILVCSWSHGVLSGSCSLYPLFVADGMLNLGVNQTEVNLGHRCRPCLSNPVFINNRANVFTSAFLITESLTHQAIR